jgi:hypothetical protein
MAVPLPLPVVVVVIVIVIAGLVIEVDIELDALDGGLGFAGGVEVITLEGEQTELLLEIAGIGSEIDEGADEHVAGDAGGGVEMEVFHGWGRGEDSWARELMELAA